MGIQNNLRKFIFIATFGILGSVAMIVLANTPIGKEFYADAWLNIGIPIFALTAYLLLVVKTWEKINNQQKLLWSLLLVAMTFFAVYETSDNWQYLPWGRASAFKTSDSFLVSMNKGDYEGATQYMKPCVREKVGTGVLRDENQTKPISWQFTDYKREYSSVSTIGTAKLVDGSEVRIEFQMSWNGFKWEIFSVIFGEPYKDAIIQFSWGC